MLLEFEISGQFFLYCDSFSWLSFGSSDLLIMFGGDVIWKGDLL